MEENPIPVPISESPSSTEDLVENPTSESTSPPLESPDQISAEKEGPDSNPKAPVAKKKGPLRTLAIDIGGTGLKVIVLDEAGKPLTSRARVATPQPATPHAVLEAIVKLAKSQGHFDRASAGFPGVVKDGVVLTAPNLSPQWKNFHLSKALRQKLRRPVRVCNDADVQGFGVIKGKGVEMMITLGTGVGSALFVDGRLVPNLELGHHPFIKGKTYEEKLGKKALDKVGKKKWNRRLLRAIEELRLIFNYHTLYIGGGNAKFIDFKLPPNTKAVSNQAGLWGGIALWKN